MDLASLAVREKLDLVTLPREGKRSSILRFDPSLDPILRFRLAGGDNLQRLRRIADRSVKADLEGVAGVAAVRVSGGEEEEIRVEVDAGRLSSVGLTLADVTRRLGEENVNLAGGSLTEGEAEYLIRAVNQFADPSEIGGVILASRPDGVIRLSDVATVSRGAKDREVIARLDGREAVEIAVYKEGDANTVSVAQAVQRHVKALKLPPELSMATVSDQSRYIENALRDVIDSGWQGGFIAKQGYYSAVPATAKKFLTPEEWDYWYDGKPAAKDLADPFGTIIIKKGDVRTGGSYWSRYSKIAVWNSLMDENDYLVKRWTEFLTA